LRLFCTQSGLSKKKEIRALLKRANRLIKAFSAPPQKSFDLPDQTARQLEPTDAPAIISAAGDGGSIRRHAERSGTAGIFDGFNGFRLDRIRLAKQRADRVSTVR
jgi:hypothetical protein